MQKFIDSSYQKIEEIWNSSEKGQNFILHLIRAFIPIDPWSHYMDTNKICCITGKKGFSAARFLKLTSESIFLRATIIADVDEAKKKEAQETYDKMVEEVKSYFDLEEGEDLQNDRKLFYSEKSDKCLTRPALIALRDFSINELLKGNKKISYATKMEMFKNADQYTETQKSAVIKKAEGMKLNTFEVDAFKQLQEKFNNV